MRQPMQIFSAGRVGMIDRRDAAFGADIPQDGIHVAAVSALRLRGSRHIRVTPKILK